jgi:serine/threonine protein kinase
MLPSELSVPAGPESASMRWLYCAAYYENGSLRKYLDARPTRISIRLAIRILVDVANGMRHLVSNEHIGTRVVHRDLNSNNVLLDANLKAVVSDFGLAVSFEATRRSKWVLWTVLGFLPSQFSVVFGALFMLAFGTFK